MNFNPTIDFSLLDMTNEENLVYWKFSELIKTLITLSSNPDRQMEIIGIGAVTDEMAEDFHSYFTLSYNQFLEYGLLHEDVINKLKHLDRFLEERSGKSTLDFWNDSFLSTNHDWQNVREQARDILILMGYTDLEITFERTEKYGKSINGQELISQMTRTRLVVRY